MNIRNHLLSWEEYNQKEFDVPYVFKKEKGGRSITYIGVRHSFNPDDEQFEVIQNEFDEFQKLDGDKIVMIEGGVNWQTLETKEETIKRYGEPAFVKSLTIEAGLEYISPEPTKERTHSVFHFARSLGGCSNLFT